MKSTKNISKAACLVSMIACIGCQSNQYQTLGQLKGKIPEVGEQSIKPMTYAEVREEYKDIVQSIDDSELREKIERRISNVYMIEGSEQYLESQDGKNNYQDAIKSYENILKKYPNSPENAEVYYQLARAYHLEGREMEAMETLQALISKYPTYRNVNEAEFRVADIYFNLSDYQTAEIYYANVANKAIGQLQRHARYMLGWTYYKLQRPSQAIETFGVVLTDIMGTSSEVEGVAKGQKALVLDGIHSMSLALNKIGGAEAIETFDEIANKPYVWLIYDKLGEYYLEKELFKISAETYRGYIDNHEGTTKVPYFYKKIISAYEQGGFPVQALAEKEAFVIAYNMPVEQFERHGVTLEMQTLLKTYMAELAKYRYTQGQAYLAEAEPFITDPAKVGHVNKLQDLAAAEFIQAAAFYGQYSDTFKDDSEVLEYRYLKAEAHFLAKDYLDAVEAYEVVAYGFADKKGVEKYAADAGYAAIIAYQNYMDANGESLNPAWSRDYQSAAVDSMMRFAKTFSGDERAAGVLTNAANYVLELEQYDRAIELMTGLLAGQQTLDRATEKVAHGIKAVSYFKLKKFDKAADSYLAERAFVKPNETEYQELSERISVSQFQYAGQLEANDQIDASIAALLSIKAVAPESNNRVIAQYDAATLLLKQERWTDAIRELKELDAQFPNHELAVEFPRKIAYAYQKNDEPLKAAEYYVTLSNEDPDTEIKREALFSAAMIYREANDLGTAIQHFKAYAHTYAQPVGARMEALYQLADSYLKMNEFSKHMYWINKIMELEPEVASTAEDRTRWILSWANLRLGDYAAGEFNKRRLRHPIAKFLPRMHEQFQVTLQAFQKTSDYGLLDHVTESSYKMAEVHHDFAKAILKAQTPPGLNAAQRGAFAEVLKQQAQPLKELAIELHQVNIERAWDGDKTQWINKSFDAMKVLSPDRFNKEESIKVYGEGLR